ncbi:MAG: hypothetical protein LAT67_08775 [Balneolales bacterium]|nr:hypothetical protein [Balneolales bacterium]
MARRVLALFAVVLVLILLLNMAISYLATSSINRSLEEIVSYGDSLAYEFQVGSTSVNTLSSSFVVYDLRLRNRDNDDAFRLEQLALNISYRDFLRLLLPRRDGTPPEIRRSQIRLTNFEADAGGEPLLSAELIMMRQQGNLSELMRGLQTNFMKAPRTHQQLEFELINLKLSRKEVLKDETDSGLRQTSNGTGELDILNQVIKLIGNETLQRLYAQASYVPGEQLLQLNDLRIVSTVGQLNGNGQIRNVQNAFLQNVYIEKETEVSIYAEDEQALQDTIAGPQEGNMAENAGINAAYISASDLSGFANARLSLQFRPEADRFHIGEDGAAIRFSTLEIGYEGPYIAGIRSEVLTELEEATITADVRDVVIFSPATFQETYGQALSFLGLSAESLRIPGIETQYTLSPGYIDIETFRIVNPFANVLLRGGLSEAGEGLSEWRWRDAQLEVHAGTEQSKSFSDMIVQFFGLNVRRLPQENGDIHYVLPLSGSVLSPVFAAS